MEKIILTQEQKEELKRLRDAVREMSFDEAIIPRLEIGSDGHLVEGCIGIEIPVHMGTMHEADEIMCRLGLRHFWPDSSQCESPEEIEDADNSGIVDGGVVRVSFDELLR